ncbi:glycosyltransferase [Tunturiibacter lichenicola]|uniref:glycosyltransferase n=1 Tax=Tunturiibacter lichenicola TaxID=2051959 RepID=UPI0021B2928F|nr:TPR domain-containing glycosyltransferase [Edaphobacter lichenicola]
MGQPSLGVSMIVKNAEATLARCLESVLPLADEIVIGDTGSTDTTVSIARRYGARVIDVPWENDFARARNRVLAEGRCDWVLVMDGDEMLDHEARLLIPPLLEIKEIFGYAVCHWNYVRERHGRAGADAALPNPMRVEESRGYPAYLTSVNTRLFRRSPEIYFEHPVHETVAERLESLGRKTPLAPFVIHHFGYVEDSKLVREGKNELYHQLGQRKLRANPGDAHACFELGKSELEHRHDAAAALRLFERAYELNPSRADLWIFAGVSLLRLARPQEAIARLQHARLLGSRSAVLYEAMGDALYHCGEFGLACAEYEQCGGVSPLVESKYGAAEVRMGQTVRGVERMRDAVAKAPEYAELYDILAAGAWMAGDRTLAIEAARMRLSVGSPSADNFLLAAKLCSLSDRGGEAHAIVTMGLTRFPQDAGLRSALHEPEKHPLTSL